MKKKQKILKIKPKPIWYQYEVQLGSDHPEKEMWTAGLVNLIVFATSDREGKEMCGRMIAKGNMQITELKRAMSIKEQHLENMGPIFKHLYKVAEQKGIDMRFDGWKS